MIAPIYFPTVLIILTWFICLRLVYHKLPVSLDCPFLIAPWVFPNINLVFLLLFEHLTCFDCFCVISYGVNYTDLGYRSVIILFNGQFHWWYFSNALCLFPGERHQI